MILCEICYAEYEEKDTFQLPNCLHRFCKVCLIEQFKTQIETSKIGIADFKCPMCNKLFNPDIIIKFLPPQLYEKYCKYALELNQIFGLEDYEMMMNCLNPKCKMQYVIWKDAEYLTCPTCNVKFCRKCDLEYHQDKNLTCEQQRELHQDANYKEAKKNSSIARCPKCKRYCEKITGCNFMTCDCKTHFCYLCDAELTQAYHFKHFQNDDPFKSPCKIWYNNDWVEPKLVPKDYVPKKEELRKPEALIQKPPPVDNPIPCPNCKNTKSAVSQLVFYDKVVICRSVECQNSAYCVLCSSKVKIGLLDAHFDALLQCLYKKK